MSDSVAPAGGRFRFSLLRLLGAVAVVAAVCWFFAVASDNARVLGLAAACGVVTVRLLWPARGGKEPDGFFLRIAVYCAAAPLFAGVIIFLLWLHRPWDGYFSIGYVNILAGLVLFGIGCVCNSISGDRSWRFWCVCLLLASNFLMAGSIIEAVATIQRRYVVQILNLSPHRVDSFVVRGNRSRVEFGTLGPDQSKTRFLEVNDGDQLVGSGSWGGQPVQITIDGYATGGGNRLQTVVIFDSDGTPRAVRVRGNVDERGLRRTGD